MISLYTFFFFSSRRRHTRYWRDWSSDVCSSDLGDTSNEKLADSLVENRNLTGDIFGLAGNFLQAVSFVLVSLNAMRAGLRSEERRVGKECRSRWSPYH